MQQEKHYVSRSIMVPSFVLSDWLMLLVSFGLAVFLRSFWGGIQFNLYEQLIPFALVIIAIFAIFGLYEVIGLSPADEIRRIVYASSLVLLIGAFAAFFTRGGLQYSRAVLLMFWPFSIFFVLLGRYLTRILGSRFRRWGVPVVLLSDVPRGRELAQALLRNRKGGLRPVAFLTRDGNGSELDQLETGPWSRALELHRELGVSTAILVTTSLAGQRWIDVVDRYCADYRRVFLVSDFLGERNLWIRPADIVGNLGLELNQNLDAWGARFLKGALDIVLSFLIALFSLPLLGLIAVVIRLDSPGSIFYSQKRIGKDGRAIRMLKFRTMYTDADERLSEILAEDEALRQEWEEFQKLQHDPRVTRVGRFLRRWSLDELPQILNVVSREMSLIGPRPMMLDQEEDYGRDLELYKKVRPGLTGLWQVSGRNRTTFADRSVFDAYYVRNWSIWLDLYILAKTPLVILRGEGVS